MTNRKPAWWQLLLLLPAMFILAALEHADPVPGVSETIVDTGIIILTFIGMLAWVHVNEGLIEHYEVDQFGWLRTVDKITVYEPQRGTHGEEKDSETEGTGPEEAPTLMEMRARSRNIEIKESHKWHLN